MNIENFVNDYLQEHRHDVLLNPYNGLIDFANAFKEQMMKDAAEERVQRAPLNGPLGISAYCCNFPSEHPFYHCKEGDKVKLIIVKED